MFQSQFAFKYLNSFFTFQPSNTKDVKFWAYVHIFHFKSWSCVIVSIICIAFGFVSIRKLDINHFHDKSDSEPFGFLNALSLALQLLIQRDYPITKKSISTRLLFITFCFTSFLLFSFYTADLTSLMTSGSPETLLRSFDAVYENGYDIIVWGGTSFEADIR